MTRWAGRLAADRCIRLGSLAAAPPLCFALAGGDTRLLVLAGASAAGAAWALRALERRRADDDESLWL